MSELSTHLSHCNFDEYPGTCKYGEPQTCPALTSEWSWLGHNLQIAEKYREEKLRTMKYGSLQEAWDNALQVAAMYYPYKSIGVQIDGPGYVAWVGGSERILDAWSIDDPELVSEPDIPSSPAKALNRLAVYMLEKRGEA